MTLEQILIMCLIGAAAGWLAGVVIRGFGLGLIGNIVIGIIGSFVGSWLLGSVLKVAISTGSPTVNSILTSAVGAAVLLLIFGASRRR
ncbi:MAG: GlsB/YeaQ/YmgE family stress response membrane protein [Bacteroidota bacterium]